MYTLRSRDISLKNMSFLLFDCYVLILFVEAFLVYCDNSVNLSSISTGVKFLKKIINYYSSGIFVLKLRTVKGEGYGVLKCVLTLLIHI